MAQPRRPRPLLPAMCSSLFCFDEGSDEIEIKLGTLDGGPSEITHTPLRTLDDPARALAVAARHGRAARPRPADAIVRRQTARGLLSKSGPRLLDACDGGGLAMRAVLGEMMLCLISAKPRSIDIAQNGSTATLSGPIRDGDQFRLRDFWPRPRATVRMLRLTSPGGRIFPAREMARDIRNAGLVTGRRCVARFLQQRLHRAVRSRGPPALPERGLPGRRGGQDGPGLPRRQCPAAIRRAGLFRAGDRRHEQHLLRNGLPGAASLITKRRSPDVQDFRPDRAVAGIATSLSAR